MSYIVSQISMGICVVEEGGCFTPPEDVGKSQRPLKPEETVLPISISQPYHSIFFKYPTDNICMFWFCLTSG